MILVTKRIKYALIFFKYIQPLHQWHGTYYRGFSIKKIVVNRGPPVNRNDHVQNV